MRHDARSPGDQRVRLTPALSFCRYQRSTGSSDSVSHGAKRQSMPAWFAESRLPVSTP